MEGATCSCYVAQRNTRERPPMAPVPGFFCTASRHFVIGAESRLKAVPRGPAPFTLYSAPFTVFEFGCFSTRDYLFS